MPDRVGIDHNGPPPAQEGRDTALAATDHAGQADYGDRALFPVPGEGPFRVCLRARQRQRVLLETTRGTTGHGARPSAKSRPCDFIGGFKGSMSSVRGHGRQASVKQP